MTQDTIHVNKYNEDIEDFEEIYVPIKPCPFAHLPHEHSFIYDGKEEEFRLLGAENGQYFIECWYCGCSGPLGESEVDAVERWNDTRGS